MAKELKNLLVNRLHDRALLRYAKEHFHGVLLDIGCGTKPYQQMFAPYVREHIGLDHDDTQHDKSNIDLHGTAYAIPAPSESFDCALCTAVLEHIEEPEAALRECARVLKPGGTAIYSAPLFWHLHEEPRDFYRYTKYGLKYLFEKAGFDVVEIKPLSGFVVTYGQELVYFLWRFRGSRRRNPLWWLVPPVALLVQGACWALNPIDRSHEFTWMYMVVARRKPRASAADGKAQ